MKAMVATVVTAAMVVLGAGNAFAMEQEGTFNFGQKLAHHEDMTVQQVREMYLKHHGTLGAGPSNNFTHEECMKMGME